MFRSVQLSRSACIYCIKSDIGKGKDSEGGQNAQGRTVKAVRMPSELIPGKKSHCEHQSNTGDEFIFCCQNSTLSQVISCCALTSLDSKRKCESLFMLRITAYRTGMGK